MNPSGALRHRTQRLTVLGSPSPHLPVSGCLQGPSVVPETSKCLLFLSHAPHSPLLKPFLEEREHTAVFPRTHSQQKPEAHRAGQQRLSFPPSFPPYLSASLPLFS